MSEQTQSGGGMNPTLKIILIVAATLVVLGCGVVVVAFVLVGRNVDRYQNLMSTEMQMQSLGEAIQMYRMDARTTDGAATVPPDLGALITGEYLDSDTVPTDGWGNPFVYTPSEDETLYELLSYGADGVPGGEGLDADIRLE